MIVIRDRNSLGRTQLGWLDSRDTWLQLARGVVEIDGDEIREGDGAAITTENTVEIQAVTPSEFLRFDLA